MSLSARAERLLMSNQPIFGRWSIQSVIGEGSSGTVYEISDSDGGKSALKVIPISNDENEGGPLSILGSDKDRAEKYIDEMTGDIMSEIQIMHSLSDKRGIVSCRDYGILEMQDGEITLRLILIRMDLLRSLNQAMRSDEFSFTTGDIVKMGIDLCSALIECRAQNIIHRDIKPANVFITPDGEYQLGDFGTAKLQERTMMASRKGTLAYIAPEIAAGQSYNAAVDVYSLGIMMYQLLNDRRLPFLDENFKFSDMEPAIEKRLSGAPFPYPANADETLGQIICKMCAFSPKERYASAEECKAELEYYIQSKGKGRRKSKVSKKLRTVLIIAAAAALTAVIAMTAATQLPLLTYEETTAAGIPSGNFNSSGMVACDGEWIYTSQDKIGKRGCRISVSDGTKEVLCDYIMSDINLTNEYVVFSSRYTMDADTDQKNSFILGLYRMKKNGDELTCLDEGDISNSIVYGSYVYYICSENNANMLCRIPIKGGTREIIGVYDKYSYMFYIVKDKIYIYSFEGKMLIKTDLDGAGKQIVISKSLLSFCIDNGKLYFICADYAKLNTVYLCDIDKISDQNVPIDLEETEKIEFSYKIDQFNVSQDVIYLTTKSYASLEGKPQDDGIWRINSDGSGIKQLYSGSASQIQIAGEKIYFYHGSTVYRMDLDGTNVTTMLDISDFYSIG